jgi:D-alanyl-D-alanine dipeptidase
MKPYQQVPIQECGEPLVPIPLDMFAVESPHPYEKLGAPYGEKSPYYVRETVQNSLLQVLNFLQQTHPEWRIQIFDAYRPVAVQQFMVDYTFTEAVRARGLVEAQLSEQQRQALWEEVYQLWAIPSLDLRTPPPHSTGAAVDITLVDGAGETVNMGSPIDEMSARSHPDYFANSTNPQEIQYHSHRELLRDVMIKAGFVRHPGEWWHFCLGDQMWAHLSNAAVARYGRVLF